MSRCVSCKEMIEQNQERVGTCFGPMHRSCWRIGRKAIDDAIREKIDVIYLGRTCVRCGTDINDRDELVETRRGSMHNNCAWEAEVEGRFGPSDHGDSVYPR